MTQFFWQVHNQGRRRQGKGGREGKKKHRGMIRSKVYFIPVSKQLLNEVRAIANFSMKSGP